jgi:hypothetical protein
MLNKSGSEVVDVIISRYCAPKGGLIGYSVDCMFHNSPPGGFCKYTDTLEQIASEVKAEAIKRDVNTPFYNIMPCKGPLALGFFERHFGAKREYTEKAGTDELAGLVDLLSK